MDVLNELSACLALVRPVGMTEDMATEWLTVAASSLEGLSDYELAKGFRQARLECTHHAQIVPTIMKANAEAIEFRRKSDALMWDRPTHRPAQIEHRGGAKRIGNLKLVEDMRHD